MSNVTKNVITNENKIVITTENVITNVNDKENALELLRKKRLEKFNCN
jgi:hypothetical protein